MQASNHNNNEICVFEVDPGLYHTDCTVDSNDTPMCLNLDLVDMVANICIKEAYPVVLSMLFYFHVKSQDNHKTV